MLRDGFKTTPIAKPEAIVQGDKYRFTVLADGLLRYEYAEDGQFEDRASTLAIHRDLNVPQFRQLNHGTHLEIITDRFHLQYDKNAFSPSGLTVLAKGGLTDWHSRWRYGASINGDEFKLGGTARTLDGVDGRLELGGSVIAKCGFAELDDSDSMVFTEEGWVSGRRPGRRVDGYLFVYGRDYKAAIRALYKLSGPQPAIPRWALGNWWSRYYRYDAEEYLDLMDQFKSEKVPFSVGVIDMDWHWTDVDARVKQSGFSGWTGYSWNTDLFPNPRGFLTKLHERGLKVTLNDHPADGVASYEDAYAEMCRAVKQDVHKGDAVAFDGADRRFMNAYFDILLKRLEDEGADFWWIDWQQGPFSSLPNVDPLWVLNHLHFLNNQRGGKRPLIFSRFAGPGSHRYPVGFSGDSVVTWNSLDFQPEFTSSASNIGYGWWSHDIGGHFGGYRDNELATRWVQLGVFSPINRLHSSNSAWNSKEPSRFIEPYRTSMIQALQLRHRLVPYLYSMNFRDLPLVQPIYWDYPDRREAYEARNCFFFGSNILVAPLTSPQDTITQRAKVRAFLPPGTHVDIFSGMIYDGDREIWMYRTLSEYVALAKPGAIIPLDGAEAPENSCSRPDSLEIIIIVGADGKFDLLEDHISEEGVNDTPALVRTSMKYVQRDRMFAVEPEVGLANSSTSHLAKRDWILKFCALDSDDEVETQTICEVDGKRHKADVARQENGFSVTIKAVPSLSKISVVLPHEPKLAVTNVVKHARRIVHEAQMAYDMKDRVWSAITRPGLNNSRLSQLRSLGLDVNFLQALEEILLADSRSWSI